MSIIKAEAIDVANGEYAGWVFIQFHGDVYENEHTMVDNNPYRFETTELKLRSGVILFSTNDALVGDSSNQRYPKSAGTTLSIKYVDLSELYFKNAGAGQNTKINIIGVKL